MTTTRTIEQILQIRYRAAELRVMERASAAVKIQEAMASAIVTDKLEEELAKLTEAYGLAVDGVALVRREIEAQKGLGEPVPYESGSGFANRRYAAVLMLDNPRLTPEEALAEAQRDDSARFQEYYARVHGDDEVDEDDTDEDGDEES